MYVTGRNARIENRRDGVLADTYPLRSRLAIMARVADSTASSVATTTSAKRWPLDLFSVSSESASQAFAGTMLIRSRFCFAK